MNEYTVHIGGIPHTVLLGDEEAAKYGEAAVPTNPDAVTDVADADDTEADDTDDAGE